MKIIVYRWKRLHKPTGEIKYGAEVVWPKEDEDVWEKVFNLYTPLRNTEAEVEVDIKKLLQKLVN